MNHTVEYGLSNFIIRNSLVFVQAVLVHIFVYCNLLLGVLSKDTIELTGKELDMSVLLRTPHTIKLETLHVNSNLNVHIFEPMMSTLNARTAMWYI